MTTIIFFDVHSQLSGKFSESVFPESLFYLSRGRNRPTRIWIICRRYVGIVRFQSDIRGTYQSRISYLREVTTGVHCSGTSPAGPVSPSPGPVPRDCTLTTSIRKGHLSTQSSVFDLLSDMKLGLFCSSIYIYSLSERFSP